MDSFLRRVDEAVASHDFATISLIFSSTGMTSLGQGEQRSLCGHLVKRAVANSDFLQSAVDSLSSVFTLCLGNLPMVVENAADSSLRSFMFDYFVNEKGDYSSAARILGGMRMDSEVNSTYFKTPAEMCEVYVKISECFLMDDDIVEADSAVTKAGTVVENIVDPDKHTSLILRYKATYARVLDANRKFLQAATRYHDLSQNSTEYVDADDLMQMLGRAATCAILAYPSGAQKQRVLGLLYSDPRLDQLDAIPSMQTHATLVKKMYRTQVIRPDELLHFEASLGEHQKAIRGDGLSILQHAVIQHNMIAVSRLYRSIYLTDLSKILGGIPAEKMAAAMIMDGSLHGEIDQVDGILYFTLSQENGNKDEWNRSIMSFCTELNKVVDDIKAVVA